jgi:putative endonuclease
MPSHATPYTVYILRSLRDRKLYVGMTTDVQRRLREHNHGKNPSTRHRRPLVLLHTEIYPTRAEAAKRERFFKGGRGHKFLKSILP